MIETQKKAALIKTSQWKTLGDAVVKKTVKTTPQDYPDAKFIGMDCIEPHSLKLSFLHDFRDFKSAGNYFKKEQVLYGRMRPYLNKVYKAEFDGTCSGEFIVLECKDNFNPDYLKYILHSRSFVRFANEKTSGDRPRISFEEISDYPVLVPSLDDQQQIVSKIEELFSELDKGIEELKTAQQQLKVYRQAVLKWAFEGKLTNEDVKDGELPEGWKFIKLGEVSSLITKGASPKWQGINYIDDSSQVLFVTSENVRENSIDISEPKYLEIAFNDKQKRSILKKGDVLLNIVGASIGRAAIYNLDYNANINQAVSVIRLTGDALNLFVCYFLNSNKALSYYNQNKVDFARANLSLADVSNIEIPFPPFEEQQQIVQEIESRLSVCDKIEETITDSLRQAEALRQSILKKAFAGRLVE